LTLCTALLASSEFPIAFAAMSPATIVLFKISALVIVLSWISDESIVLSVILSPPSVPARVRLPGSDVVPFVAKIKLFVAPAPHCLLDIIRTSESAVR